MNKLKKTMNPAIFCYAVIASMSILYLTDSSHTISALALILAPAVYLTEQFSHRFSENKKTAVLYLIFSCVFSVSLFAGKYVMDLKNTGTARFPFYAVLYLIAFTCFIYSLIRIISSFIANFNAEGKAFSAKLLFVIAWVSILICWIPYFLSQYPAAMTYDAIKQVKMAKGIIPLTDHHPVLHTMFIKFCLWLGNGSPAVYSVLQMLILSAMFAFSIYWLNKRNFPKWITLITWAWFALNPLHATYSVNMHKDILFSGFALLLAIALAELTLAGENRIKNKKWHLLFLCACMGICFMRNNGPIVVFMILAILAICFRKNRKSIAVIAAALAICLFTVKGPVFRLLNVQPTHFVESVGIPLQQMARTAVEHELTPSQEERLSQYLPIEEIREKYNPYCVDPLKSEVYGTSFNHDALEKDKAGFFLLWGELLLSHPDSYITAYLDETYGYWYSFTPSDVSRWSFISENDLGLSVQPVSQPLADMLGKLVTLCFDMKIPVVNILFSAAGMVFICLFFALPSYKKYGKTGFLAYLPVLLLWATLLIAAPIATSLRYLYCAFTCIPVLAVIPFAAKKEIR